MDVFYSVKANSNLSVLRHLKELGAGFDVVSGGELLRVLAAGADPSRVSFAGVAKTAEELLLAVKHDVIVHVESAEEVPRLQEAAASLGRRARFGIRINPGVKVDTLVHMQTGSDRAKFGVTSEVATSLLDRVVAGEFPDLVPLGVHMHVGSMVPEPADMVRAAAVLVDVLRHGRESGLTTMRRLDLGGGFPISYDGAALPSPADFAAALEPLLEGLDADLVLEPGRYIAGPAGVLVTSVTLTKRPAGRRMVLVDTGMHHFVRPALYQAAHRILPLEERPSAGPAEVVGPICESTDQLAPAADLPDLAPGDLLAVMDTGAYGMVMASNYNNQPRPPEIVVSGGQARVARRRETWQDLLMYEE
ncbi:diaminopimelate decarboxylase [Nonomuraea africana]|uniref:Diaminopimelate decarboxylase n=1 Tax=Nonomuraea africana TaxID=46171 RepID=A0ABR9K883_9ACTN|nr:diaminopimelate decarboxylase [Nonomuraea africana]